MSIHFAATNNPGSTCYCTGINIVLNVIVKQFNWPNIALLDEGVLSEIFCLEKRYFSGIESSF